MNVFGLRDTRSFVIDPAKTSDPIKARTEKINFVMGLNHMDLAKNPMWNTEAIRALATGLIPVFKDGKRLPKNALIDELAAFIQAEREANSLSLRQFEEDYSIDVSLVDAFFAALSQQLSDTDIAEFVVDRLAERNTTDTSLVQTAIRNLFKAMQKDDRYIARQEAITRVKRAVYALPEIKQKGDSIRTKYKAKVIGNMSALVPVKIDPVLEYIDQVLNGRNWQDLTYAIALATGRRMGEILGNHSTWRVSEDGHLLFKGILKGKNRKVDSRLLPSQCVTLELTNDNYEEYTKFAIPLIDAEVIVHSLVDAERIIQAIEKLNTLGKRDNHHERVNVLYAKAFSNRATVNMIRMREESGLYTLKDGKRKSEFKMSRDCYAAYQAKFRRSEYEQTMTEQIFVMQQLHHDDPTTTNSYQTISLTD